MPDETIYVDDMVEELSNERMMLATARALRVRGIDHEWSENGTIQIFDMEPDELADDVLFMDEFHDQIKRLCADDLLYNLERKGLLVSHADDHGEITWTLAEGVEV